MRVPYRTTRTCPRVLVPVPVQSYERATRYEYSYGTDNATLCTFPIYQKKSTVLVLVHNNSRTVGGPTVRLHRKQQAASAALRCQQDLRYGTVGHKFFCTSIGFCLAFSVCPSRFRGLPQDMAVPSRCLRRDFPKKVKSIFSYGIARPLENKLRMDFDAYAEFRETPDYHKNCSPSCTSDSYSYAFCRSKLIILLLLTRARRDATPPIVQYQIVFLFGIVRYESTAKNIFCIETRVAVSVDLSRPAEETQGYSTTSTVQARKPNVTILPLWKKNLYRRGPSLVPASVHTAHLMDDRPLPVPTCLTSIVFRGWPILDRGII